MPVYSHSFSPAFYGDTENPDYHCDRPTTLADAIASMGAHEWQHLARDVFSVPPEHLAILAVVDKAVETDTVDGFVSPIEVWIDPMGDYRVFVWDE